MRKLYSVLLGAALCLALQGCDGGLTRMVARIDPPGRPPSNDIPDAQPLDSDRSRTLFLIVVQGLREAGKPRAALAYLRGYQKLYPDDAQAQLLMADCLADTGQGEAAAPIYTGLLSGEHAAPAQAGLGRVAAARADWANATTHFGTAVMLDAANVTYLNDLGYAQVMLAQYDTGVATLRQASELAPDNAMVRGNLILGLHLAGRDADAKRVIDQIAVAEDRTPGAALLQVSAASLRAEPQVVPAVATLVTPPAQGTAP